MKSKQASKPQKRSWYDKRKQQQQQANPKGKGKANEVMFVNEVEMYNASVEDDDDPLFKFIDHLEEDQNMDVDEDASSMVAHAGWADDEEDGLNTAGPSRSFRRSSF